GDLTFRTAFPIMATNALAWFAGQTGELRESLASGAVTEVTLPPGGADTLVCRSPGGRILPLPKDAAKAPIGPLDECGLWSVMRETSTVPVPSPKDGTRSAPAPEPIIELACNLASRTESDLRVPDALLKAQPKAVLAAGWFTRPIWFYLVGAAWLLAWVEWFLYQGRWVS